MTLAPLHRCGGLGITSLWKDNERPEVAPEGWVDSTVSIRKILVTSTRLIPPLELEVSETRYAPGDVKGRYYTDGKGNREFWPVPPYAIRDLEDFEAYYPKYVAEIAEHWLSVRSRDSSSHKELLRLSQAGRLDPQFIHYLFSRWMKTGSAFLSGRDKLDQDSPLPKDAKTHPNEFAVPRLCIPQVDYVSTNYLNKTQIVLFEPGTMFDKLLNRQDDTKLHVAYVLLCVLAEETIWVLQDSIRQGQQNGKPGFSAPENMVDAQGTLIAIIDRFVGFLRYFPGYDASHDALHEEDKIFYTMEVVDNGWESVGYWLPSLKSLFGGWTEPKPRGVEELDAV